MPGSRTERIIVMAAVLLVALMCSVVAAAAGDAPRPGTLSAEEQLALDLLNADRKANGLQPLKINFELVYLARNYAQDMIDRSYFSHYSPEGLSPFDRMDERGVVYRFAAENLAAKPSVEAAEKAFMNSPHHRDNILDANYSEVGIGVRHGNGAVYVVQDFIGR